jgi:flagellar assembly protein FliH
MPVVAPILRGIVMHAQPHALVRPDRPGATAPAVKIHPPAPMRAEPVGDGAPGRKTPMYEQAFAEGRKEGYAAGWSAAAEEGKQSSQAAIDQARAAAVEDGRVHGLREGRERAQVELEQAKAQAADQASAAMQPRLDQLDRLLEALAAETARRFADAEDELVALGHEAICCMLGDGAATPAVIRSMVKHLLARHGARTQLAVHVHPDDLNALDQEAGTARDAWRWVADNSVQLGGAILRSPEGSLDARLETQLTALRDALLTVRRERKAAANPLSGSGQA